jgi:hypothetical protein
MAFWDERALPAGVRDPREGAPLTREARIRRFEDFYIFFSPV